MTGFMESLVMLYTLERERKDRDNNTGTRADADATAHETSELTPTTRKPKSTALPLALVGLSALLVGCRVETNSGGEYDRTVKLPTECCEVLSAGYSTTMYSGAQANYDWVACKDAESVTVHRMSRHEGKWYKTRMVR